MFNKKAIRDLSNRVNTAYSDMNHLQNEIYTKIAFKNTAECDGCGCLLIKAEKFKHPSTVAVEEVKIYSYGYSGVPPLPFTVQKKEVIVEHYKCHRCSPPDVQKPLKVV